MLVLSLPLEGVGIIIELSFWSDTTDSAVGIYTLKDIITHNFDMNKRPFTVLMVSHGIAHFHTSVADVMQWRYHVCDQCECDEAYASMIALEFNCVELSRSALRYMTTCDAVKKCKRALIHQVVSAPHTHTHIPFCCHLCVINTRVSGVGGAGCHAHL